MIEETKEPIIPEEPSDEPEEDIVPETEDLEEVI